MAIKLINGNSLEELKTLDDNSVDSIVTDPPYEIGFMGKKWDNTGIAYNQELWSECLRVLKPGGHLLAFGATRSYHRMTVAIEDSGFEIRDCIMWLYGSGFPKSHNIGKALDKNNGNGNIVYEVAEKLKEARESRGISKTEADKLFCNGSTNYSWLEGRKGGVRLPEDELFEKIVNEWPELKPYQELVKSANREIVGKYDTDMGGLGGERLGGKNGDITLPATPVAKQWEGWGTALKPAVEPVVMARKPFKGTVADNVLEHGTGAINIDECRVSHNDPVVKTNRQKNTGTTWNETNSGIRKNPTDTASTDPKGRWPANVILDEEAGAILNEQSGISKPSKGRTGKMGGNKGALPNFAGSSADYTGTWPTDNGGGASRFFYCPKANKTDRNEGCDELEEKMSGHSTADKCAKCGKGILKDLRTNVGCNCEEPERVGISSKNNHPTVKPTDLLAYLIRLVTPKGGVVLDPFMGSGSCGKAAVREGMSYIGIELEREYYEIAQTRIKHEQDKHKNPFDKFTGNPDEENI